ncbi:MAG: cysteine synthase A [Verrucomicrobiota bacterium]|jgi:cysteine synthase A|nr:cysteine synthase A [Verrucomicrobiota bacterium]
MSRIYQNNPDSIGNTPLVKLNRLPQGGHATVLVKVEGRNPSYSVKCRVGANMVWEAEKQGLLKPEMELVEPTSGNSGIALAYVAASRGYKLTLTMPETMSVERRRVLLAFGANLVLTPGADGMKGSIQRAEELAAERPEHFFMPHQFENPANPAIHEQTTGPEIWDDTGGNVDVFVAGVGTGGTLTGVSRYLKNTRRRHLTSVAVEPTESPVISQKLAGKPLSPGKHGIQGIGAGFIPGNLDLSLLDQVETVRTEEAIETARRMAKEEGILCGISSGAATAVAIRLAKQAEYKGKVIVVVLPDAGERYLSTPLFQNETAS